MCGLFIAINHSGVFEGAAFDRLVALTDLVSYRGPDASGYRRFLVKSCNSEGDGKFDVFLGHRRLSIIDVSSAANQPFTDGAGLWIVFNGEIFNYVEVRQELKQLGHEFRTASDTEVILKAYAQWGEQGFARLNGMWAFAIVDLPQKKIVVSRDRFSIKPLFLLEDGGCFYLASEIKQLLPLLPKRELNLRAMAAFLEQGLLEHDNETFFPRVVKVKSKSAVTICMQSGEVRESFYWDYRPEGDIEWKQAVELFRELLIDSVRIRLRSDVKIGALLSGGLDSSVISVISTKLLGNDLETYSIVARRQEFSEERFIDYLHDRACIRNTKLMFECDDLLQTLDTVLHHNDEPFAGFSVVAQYKILEKIKQETDITVVLSGQGGDELLMGYLKYFFFYLQELVRKRRFATAGKEFLSSLINRTVVTQFRAASAKRYIPFMQRRKGQKVSRLEHECEPLWAFDDLKGRQKDDIDKYSVPILTHYEDRNSMAHSLETRLPFLDHRLVNLVVHLPAAMKLRSGWTKYILREAFPEIPEQIRWRRDKQGFLIPEDLWLKSSLKTVIPGLFHGSRLAQMGIIHDDRVLSSYQQFCNGSHTIAGSQIAGIFIAELWARKFLN